MSDKVCRSNPIIMKRTYAREASQSKGLDKHASYLLMDMSDSRLDSEGVRRSGGRRESGGARGGDGDSGAVFSNPPPLSSVAASSSSAITFRSSVTLGRKRIVTRWAQINVMSHYFFP